MKAHEETWELVPRNGGWRLHAEGEEEHSTFWDADPGRARLAAAAPEMARLLLELQWSGGSYEGDHMAACCPSCEAFSVTSDVTAGKHEPGCRLAAVLQKAGVLQEKA